MSAWTAERLDALPLGTVIEYRMRAGHPAAYWAVKTDDDLDCWHRERTWETSAWMAQQHDIRVASVPIDALLHPRPGGFDLGRIDPTSEAALMVVRAAIAHVTGEQS